MKKGGRPQKFKEPMKPTSIKMPNELRIEFRRRGGSEWLRRELSTKPQTPALFQPPKESNEASN